MEWTHEQKSAVWNKAAVVGTNDPKVYRQDQCGAWIKWSEHGKRDSQYGWEIDHITPKSRGGGSRVLSGPTEKTTDPSTDG